MIEIRRILCPTDLSDIAPRAFGHALALARFHQAEVELAYVSEPLLPGPVAPASYPPWAILDPAVRGRLQSALEQLAAPAREAGVPVRFGVYEGRVVAELLDRARGWPADILVMGTHGRGGFERWVLGSVTEKVLRKSPCPVLTVPPPAAGGLLPVLPVLFRRIVCPVDFSGASHAALGYALKLAEESSAEIAVVHVLEWLIEEEPGARIAGFDVPEFRRYLEKDARERLAALVPADARNWCRPTESVVGGRPWREILRIAEEKSADLVVMGVRGRNPVDLAVFGSTTHHVVRGAKCPVLVVHKD
jgi:nucleotide-binding universal stress UspA family protein